MHSIGSIRWRPSTPLGALMRPGRRGRTDGAAGVAARDATPAGMASVVARAAEVARVRRVLAAELGIAAPTSPVAAFGSGMDVTWTGPDQWFARSKDAAIADRLKAAMEGAAAVCDQSASRCIIALSGLRVRDMLAKGCPIDLHPLVFPPGATAATVFAHVNVQLWLGPDGRTFEIGVPVTYARSFWHWLEESSLEFGLAIDAPDLTGPDDGTS